MSGNNKYTFFVPFCVLLVALNKLWRFRKATGLYGFKVTCWGIKYLSSHLDQKAAQKLKYFIFESVFCTLTFSVHFTTAIDEATLNISVHRMLRVLLLLLLRHVFTSSQSYSC